MSRLRLCILTTSFPRNKNDPSSPFLYELGKNLAQQGIEVSVVAPHDTKTKDFEIMEGMKIYRFSYFLPRRMQRLAYGSGITANLGNGLLAKIQVIPFVLSQAWMMRKVLHEEKIDIINAHWIIPSGLIAAIFKKVYGVNNILTVHAAGLFALGNLFFHNQLAGFILDNTDKTIAVSSYIKKQLEKTSQRETNAKILPMGVDTKSFSSKKDRADLEKELGIEAENILLFVGRLHPKKGLGYLIDAMEEIKLKIKDPLLVIVGEGVLENHLREKVREKGLSDHVLFTGKVPQDEIVDYYDLCDLVVIPSIMDEKGETEGMPVVLLEALASGNLVVASDISGMKDVIEDGFNGFLIEACDSEKLADTIITSLKHPKRGEIKENALETGRGYDWENVAREYVDIFKRVKTRK